MTEYSDRAIEVAKRMQDLRDPAAPSSGESGYFYEDAATAERVLAALALAEPVLTEVGAERATHAVRGFDVAHDQRFGVQHLMTLSESYAHRSDTGYYERADLVKSAALIVAAIDRFDAGEVDR